MKLIVLILFRIFIHVTLRAYEVFRTRIDSRRLHLRLLLELLIVDRSFQLILSMFLLENATDHVILRMIEIIAGGSRRKSKKPGNLSEKSIR